MRSTKVLYEEAFTHCVGTIRGSGRAWNGASFMPVWEGGLSPRAECPPGHSALGQTVPH